MEFKLDVHTCVSTGAVCHVSDVSGQVVSCVFQYLRMVREQGPERRLWEELNAVERNEFNFMEPVCSFLSV